MVGKLLTFVPPVCGTAAPLDRPPSPHSKLEDVRTKVGRFELVDDYERASHRAVMADDNKVATVVRSLLPALRERVDMNQNIWIDVTNLVRRSAKTKQTAPSNYVRDDNEGNEDPSPMQTGAVIRAPGKSKGQ